MSKQIKLTKGMYTLVDDIWFNYLNQWSWCFVSDGGYARRTIKNQKGVKVNLKMHRVINKTPNNLETDHRNGNRLDNRSCNLRNATNTQNHWNMKKRKNCSSKYKGVHYHKCRKTSKKWRARIVMNKKQIFLGYFECEIKAAKRYDQEALKLFGEFAKINFPMIKAGEGD